MIDEAYEILDYLPIRFKQESEQEYIKFLWDAFDSNYKTEKYQFAFIAYHMLFMSFVYFNIWQIKSVRTEDFNKIKLGFNDEFGDASNPFLFSIEGESRVFDLLKYQCASNADVKSLIGKYKALVRERNSIAHANGNIPFRTVEYLEKRIRDVIRYTDEIQSYSKEIIQECFEKFLIDSQDIEQRQYSNIKEQTTEVLIHQHYLSLKDIQFCLDYDIEKLKEQPNYVEIENIFKILSEEYAKENEPDI